MLKPKNYTHENFDRTEKVKTSSNKAFGRVFGTFFLILALIPIFSEKSVKPWALSFSLIFFAAASFMPKSLTIPNRIWTQFGLILNQLVSPLVLAFLFFLIFTPIGLFLRLIKKDVLNLKIEKCNRSYWIKSAAAASSMKDQF